MSSSEELKALGNEEFKKGNHEAAIDFFSRAIAEDPSVDVTFSNRSMAYAFMQNWVPCLRDAISALKINHKNHKAQYYVVKAYIELKNYKDARLSFLNSMKMFHGQPEIIKNFAPLGPEIERLSGIPLKLTIGNFRIDDELGDGNFSKVYKATYIGHYKSGEKPTSVFRADTGGKEAPSSESLKNVYAIKIIQKQVLEKMKRRHPNINNEVMMEKRALNKLTHPHIINLYSTFHDADALYYQMEYLPGGEVWSLLHEKIEDPVTGASISVSTGCHHSLIPFIMLQCINALEYMHRHGMVHRDIKPENIMMTRTGHVKLIDFGTCKDLCERDLNGQEFVGTPEYMPPSTIRNVKATPPCDLWSLGVVMYHLIAGSSPFYSVSPYGVFLKIKRAFIRMPTYVPPSTKSLLRLLITKSDSERFANASHSELVTAVEWHPKVYSRISYDKLREHEYFSAEHSRDTRLATLKQRKETHKELATLVPSLVDLCVRAAGSAAIRIADATALNGGIKPSVKWMKAFQAGTMQLPELLRNRIVHYLMRRKKLHVYDLRCLFFPRAVDAKTYQIDANTYEYIGAERNCEWDGDGASYPLLYLSCPVDAASDAPYDALAKAVSQVNKYRPKAIIIAGNFISPGDGEYAESMDAFRKCTARISESIPVLYVPGDGDVGSDLATLQAYRSRFGSDYFGFWFYSMRIIVANSSLLLSSSGELAEEAAAHKEWLEEEIESCKLLSNHTVLFMHHSFFVKSFEEPHVQGVNFPPQERRYWLELLRHEKIRLVFGTTGAASRGSFAREAGERPAFTASFFDKKRAEKEEREKEKESKRSERRKWRKELERKRAEEARLKAEAAALAPGPKESTEEEIDKFYRDAIAMKVPEEEKVPSYFTESEPEVDDDEEEDPYLGPTLVYSPRLVADAAAQSREGGGRLLTVTERDVRSRYYSRLSDL